MVVRVNRNELTSQEVLDLLDRDERVIIEVEMIGTTMEMAIRKHEDVYYCDTPVKLLTYETESAMQTCLERYRLAKSSDGEPGDDRATPSTE